jgi:MraZ protein
MFLGEYRHNLDAKGRMSVPVKFRSDLGSSAIVTKGLDSCLFLYPKGEWEIMAQKIAQLPIANSSARAFARTMLSGAMEVEIDKFGRALLPTYLRDYAGIEGDMVVAGVFNRVEIWDKEKWQKYTSETDQNSSEIADKLSEWEL